MIKKKHVGRDLIFEEKRQKALEKKLGCKFIRINTSKEGYDADYEASRIQTFISKFKDGQLKRTRRQNRKIDRSNHSVKSKCLKCILKKILPTI